MERAQSPFLLGGVSRMVCNTFMSRILWMKSDSSRHTTNRYKENTWDLTMSTFLKTGRKLPRDSFWQPRSWRCSCSCIFPFPFWNGRPSASGGQIGSQWPPDYLKIIFLRCKHRRYLNRLCLVFLTNFLWSKSYYCNKLALRSRLRSRNTVYIPCVCQRPRKWCLD